jgi:CelD/BcsL family acetyltransferase involved in cellulose biosynthesis
MATPFQSPAWLLPWWRAFHPGDLMTVAAERNNRLVGLALFYREFGHLGRRLLPVGISLSDYHDVLLDPAEMIEVWPALIATMFEEGDWDSWEWEDLPPDAAALVLPIPTDQPAQIWAHSSCPVLTLAGARLSENLPRHQRAAFKLALNRARRLGAVSIEVARNDTTGVLLDHVIHLHGLRWRSRGEPGVFADPLARQFHRNATRELHQAGLLRLYALRIGAHLVAAYYGFSDRNRAYYYLSGFDPVFAFESPGVIIVGYAIENALQEGVREFHFLRGREAYKYAWGAVDRWNQCYSILRNRLGGISVSRQQTSSNSG